MNTSDRHGLSASSPKLKGRFWRLFEIAADAISPPLACEKCGAVAKRRRYTRTGATYSTEAYASRWMQLTLSDEELVCPQCGESMWIEYVTHGRGVGV